ncbi:MAG: hypothetical protein Q9181_000920 [Wetmoreana brouardii]
MATFNGYRGPRRRNPPPQDDYHDFAKESGPAPKLNTRIRDYVKGTPVSNAGPTFIREREIPTPDEISIPKNDEEAEVPVNQVVGPWASKEKYLSDHYALLREDGVTPLRNVVSELKAEPHILEKDSVENACIYEKVFIVGLTFAQSGVAAKVTFSLRRAEKKIHWEQSKRLQQGTLVALTPVSDMFAKVCKVAIVAARPLSGLQSNPPQIDIFFGSPEELEIDPQQEWLMVESARGYFEAYRHTLKCLQEMAKEAFPLAEYIVGVEREIRPPWYLQKQPVKDLSSLFHGTGEKYAQVDILDGQWPNDPTSELDASQVAALRRILAKELAIVQGPPGTGKTHVSVVALKVLLANKRHGDPPIIVAAHTNHALDQLLRHIAPLEPEFIRLGGMSLDEEIIRPRMLFEIKQATKLSVIPGGMKGPAFTNMRKLVKEMQALLKPLTEGRPFNEEVLRAYGILTDGQCKCLLEGAANWVDTTMPDSEVSAISKWASEELIQANSRTMPDDFGFEYEEIYLEYEQLNELEAEGKLNGDDDFEALKGEQVTFDEPWTGRQRMDDQSSDNFESVLTTTDLWRVPTESRGLLYRCMQRRVKHAMLDKLRRLAKEYERHAVDLKIGKWEVDTNYLQATKIIGCTTTGLSKYRGLLNSLQPKIVLIEEAAETLEAYVAAACFESIEHLVLVGDHQQLRGHCNEQELEGYPWFLDVSMFERLVRNQVGFTQLTRQRRMHPEIRRGLMPIYPRLEDHPSVHSRVPVPGMGGTNTFFFSHTWPEDSDDLMSKVNRTEAIMVVGFFNYLIHNGMTPKEITVLTFYNGQRKLILSGLRSHPNLQGEKFRVVTVDSYQGEENCVVLLSLVRSNQHNNIGFLSAANRVCVALSRAQRGFYIFGNARMLCKASLLWFEVVKAMRLRTRTFSATSVAVGSSVVVTSVQKYATSLAHALATNTEKSDPASNLLTCPYLLHLFDLKKMELTEVPEVERVAEVPQTKHPVALPPKATLASHFAPLQSPFTPRPYTPAQHPQVIIQSTPGAQAFRDFAAGGHTKADAASIAAAKEVAAKELLRQLDEENEVALFGDLADTFLSASTNELKLTATRQTTDGTVRKTFEGVYRSPDRGSNSRMQEPSLLD